MAILNNAVLSRAMIALAALFVAQLTWGKSLPLWKIEDADSSVFIMGSVHMLRASDYPLSEGLNKAYELADTITMEIDMSAIDQAASQNAIAVISIDPDGRKLRDLIGPQAYSKADDLAADIGIPLVMFDQFEPWFAALSVTQLRMVQLGFDPAWGVETVFTRKALAEAKPINGLETLPQQLGFMDQLDTETQKDFLLQSLEEAATVQDEVNAIVRSWKEGDAAGLEKELLKGIEKTPALYEALLVKRNKTWIKPIRGLLDEPGTHLVIVGAMHLVGDDSVLELLKDSGSPVQQLTDADFKAN